MLRERLSKADEQEQTGLNELLEANGCTRDQLFSGEPITYLEMFLHEYPRVTESDTGPSCTSAIFVDWL